MSGRWQDAAACRFEDPALWFPPENFEDPRKARPSKEEQRRAAKAGRICGSCSVSTACLIYALEHRVLGVWAGTSIYQRDEMRKILGIRPEPVLTINGPRHRRPASDPVEEPPEDLWALTEPESFEEGEIGRVLAFER